MTHELVINDIYLGRLESLNLTQTYDRIPGGRGYLRMANGALVAQCFWDKIITRISGEGWIPPALAQLVEGQSYTIKCVAPRTVASATPSLTIPTRRTDVAVEYSAWVGGQLVDWNGSATLTGAQSYRATYVPQLTAILTSRSEAANIYPARFPWSLTFEEV